MKQPFSIIPDPQRAFLVGLALPGVTRQEAEDSLNELASLALTAGAEVAGRAIQERPAAHPATFVGSGKAEEIARSVEETGANLVIVDDDLSGVQAKNLEKMIGQRVVDRSGLILDIFALRARSAEAMTQVELAQLEYTLPRLVRQWSHLERQEGAIGTRGPGETQLETDRRAIWRRIDQLKRDLERIARQRSVRRRSRERFFKAALVGYTNAGKSTLFNALTSAEVLVEDRLFATLDAAIRAVQLDGERILVADTVGFIRKLPHHLVASFRSTLEESLDADLLIHVVDASHPRFEEQMQTVENTLKDLDVAATPVLTVFNKVDRLPDLGLITELKTRHPDAVWISALKGMGLVTLKRELAVRLQSRETEFEVRVPIRDGRMLASVYEHARVVARTETDDSVILTCRGRTEAVQQVLRIVQPYGSESPSDE